MHTPGKDLAAIGYVSHRVSEGLYLTLAQAHHIVSWLVGYGDWIVKRASRIFSKGSVADIWPLAFRNAC